MQPATRGTSPEGAPATRRTEVLRAADWRFLLPAPPEGGYGHLVLLAGAGGAEGRASHLAEALVESGLARRVTSRLSRSDPADALVMLGAGAVPSVGSLSGLAPGGVAYLEVDRSGPGRGRHTPGRIQRTARRAGLRRTGLYWVTPDLRTARRYVPLDRSGALAWYLANRRTAETPRRRLVGGGLRLLAARPRWLAPFVRCYAVTAVRPASAGAEPALRPPSLLANPDLPDDLARGEVAVLLLTSGQDLGSRVVLLPFGRGEDRPRAVIKVPRIPAYNGQVQAEQATLAALRARLDGRMRETLPRPLGSLRFGALRGAVESLAPGPSLLASRGWGAPLAKRVEDLNLATDWIARFHAQTEMRRDDLASAEVRRRLLEPCRAFADLYGPDPDVAALMGRVHERSSDLAGVRLPRVCRHDDFGPWNVHRHGDRVTVIDWEGPPGAPESRAGPALCDLLYFVSYWSYLASGDRGRAGELEGFRDAFLVPVPSRAGLAARRAICRYGRHLRLDLRLVPILLVRTFAERALDAPARRQAAGLPAAPQESRFTAHIRTLARERDDLFGLEWGPVPT